MQPFFSRGLAQQCPSLGDIGGHLITEAARCKEYGDKTWKLIADDMTAWMLAELEFAKKAGHAGAVPLKGSEDVSVASRRELKRRKSLAANEDMNAALGGDEDESQRKRPRTVAASQELVDGVGLGGKRQAADEADGDASEKHEEQEDPSEARLREVAAVAADLNQGDEEPPANSAPLEQPSEKPPADTSDV